MKQRLFSDVAIVVVTNINLLGKMSDVRNEIKMFRQQAVFKNKCFILNSKTKVKFSKSTFREHVCQIC